MQFESSNLQAFNTLNLPAKANFAVLSDLKQLDELSTIKEKIFFLGGGSNVVMPQIVKSHVLKIALKGIKLIEENDDYYLIQAFAGENWHEFVAYCIQRGWYGLENLALIPGTVGAAPVQNIGAYGVELDQVLDSVFAMNMQNGKFYELQKKDCGFAYRDSMFKQAGAGQWLITKVNFKLPKKWQANVSYPDLQKLLCDTQPSAKNIFTAVCAIRSKKLPDPAVLPNAGSFFKNPVVSKDFAQNLLKTYPDLRYFSYADQSFKLAAAWLIDQAGWRGKSLGKVGMHVNQALVVVNYGGAVAADVLALADKIKGDVKNKFGVALEQEPVILV